MNTFRIRIAAALVVLIAGCTVSPGFDFEDFELAKKKILSEKYPAHHDLINRMCRQ